MILFLFRGHENNTVCGWAIHRRGWVNSGWRDGLGTGGKPGSPGTGSRKTSLECPRARGVEFHSLARLCCLIFRGNRVQEIRIRGDRLFSYHHWVLVLIPAVSASAETSFCGRMCPRGDGRECRCSTSRVGGREFCHEGNVYRSGSMIESGAVIPNARGLAVKMRKSVSVQFPSVRGLFTSFPDVARALSPKITVPPVGGVDRQG